MRKLSGSQVRHLRALGHSLKPVVQIGKAGLTETVLEATATALATHELIKVKVQPEAPIDRKEAASALAEATDSTLAQVLGRTFLLYRRHPSKPRIALPGEKPIREPKEPTKSKRSLRKPARPKKDDATKGPRDTRRGARDRPPSRGPERDSRR